MTAIPNQPMKNITRLFCFLSVTFSAVAQPQYNTLADMDSAVQNPIVLRRATTLRILGELQAGDWGPAKDFRYDPTNTLPINKYRRAIGTNTIGRLVHDANGEIGTWSVASITERDNIPLIRRSEGMTVYVESTGVTYKLDPGLNSWTALQTVDEADWDAVAILPTQAEVFQKVSTYAVPLTLRQSSSDVLMGFVRNSEAFDPELGSHVSSNVIRAFPLAFGSKFGQAALIERLATNIQYAGPPEGQLTAVRYTISTNVIAGPFGTAVPAIAYTDTSDVNTHYLFYDNGPASGAPVHYGKLFKPNNLTNVVFQMQAAAVTNSAWNIRMTATLDGRDVLPAITLETNGPTTWHDGGYVRLLNGWYYGWMNLTLSNATSARVYLSPANFSITTGRTNFPAFFTAGYNYSSTPEALETPVYPLSKTNSALIKSKPQDTYAYTILQPIKSGDGSLILWLKNGFKQPTNATLIESGGFRVEMTRTTLTVTMPDQGAGVSLTASVPQLSTFGERVVALSWSTNGLRAFIDGALVGSSSPPTGAFAFDYTGVIGRASADTNFWNGHIAAAYLGTSLTDDEVAYLPKVIGPPDELETFKSLASRTGTEGETAPLPLNEVTWSPRFVGDGIYPYVATNKAKELHATASLWVYLTTNDTRVAGLKAVTPFVGAAFNPSFTQTPSFIEQTNALMIDFVTGQYIKPALYGFAGGWSGCANRPLFKSIVENVIDAYYNLGISDIQMDDPGINHTMALPYLSYYYGSGNTIGTLSSPSRGCNCVDCQAAAVTDGYSPLSIGNLRAFHTQTTTNFWTWLGGKVRENSGMRISANLGTSLTILPDGYQEGRFHYPMVEAHSADSYPDGFISNWKTFSGRLVSTYAVNTQSTFEEVFGASDRTRRWMAGCYAMGFLPILPWDVYAGLSSRAFAARQDIVDISGFVRSKGDHLLRDYNLAGAVGETLAIPADTTVAAWASTNQVLVTVRHRDSDGRRVIHCVDFRDTPSSFTLYYYTPIVGNGSATIYQPATYNVTNQDYAVSTGDFTQLATSSEATVTKSNSVAQISMSAGLWRIIEVQP